MTPYQLIELFLQLDIQENYLFKKKYLIYCVRLNVLNTG